MIRRQHEKGNKVQQELIERDREVLKQVMDSKIRESKYNERYKWLRVEGTAKYVEERGERVSQKLLHARDVETQKNGINIGIRRRVENSCYVRFL